MTGYSYINFDQRKEIERLYESGKRKVEIAEILGRSPAAIYEEIRRGYNGKLYEDKRLAYDAELAQTVFQQNIQRRGARKQQKGKMKND